MDDRIKDFLKNFVDEYGESSVVNNIDRELDVISTGSLSLDISLGIGGIPRGRFTEIVGPESSGKTTLALTIAKEAMLKGDNVLYLDAERSLDAEYVSKIVGEFDTDKLIILSPQTAENFFSVAEDAINSGAFGLVILDSLGAVSPEKELTDELTDANVALLARLLTKWLRRNSFMVKEHNIAFVFLNQVRSSIGSYMKGYVSPGGNALKHYKSIEIKLTKGGKIDVKGEIFGIITKFTISKNKLAPPFRSSTIPIVFGKGVDYYRDVLEFATKLGVIRRAGAYYRFDEVTLGQGIVKSKQYLSTNPETLDKIIEMCYNIVLPEKEKE